MAFLPAFLAVADGHVAVVGKTAAAQSKFALLRHNHIPVRWFSDRAPDETEIKAAVAIVSAAGSASDDHIAAVARHHRVPINVVDRPEISTFSFPAIVARGQVLVAVSTGGASPVLARRLREKIEALLPTRLDVLAAFVRTWRSRLGTLRNPRANDRRFWERVIDGPAMQHVLEGRIGDANRTMRELMRGRDVAAGSVALVGAGPGDPDLLTLKALRVLQDADVIFYDDLVTSEVLALARRDAEKVYVGKRGDRPGIPQAELNRCLIEQARKGRRVVRLKGGDPLIFGRGGEELESLRTAGISITIVPGITAALGCSAENELPLTFRNEATRLLIVTARNSAGVPADWSGTNTPGTTLVIYMGLGTAGTIRDGLIAAGWKASKPTAVLARGTRANSAAVTGVLSELPALVARAGEGPAILVVGDVVAHSRPWQSSQHLEAAA